MTRSLHFHKRYQLLLASLPSFPLLPLSYIRMLFFYLYEELPPSQPINEQFSIYQEIKAFFNLTNKGRNDRVYTGDITYKNGNKTFNGDAQLKNVKYKHDHKVLNDFMSQEGGGIKSKDDVSLYKKHGINKDLNKEEMKNQNVSRKSDQFKNDNEITINFNKNDDNEATNIEINGIYKHLNGLKNIIKGNRGFTNSINEENKKVDGFKQVSPLLKKYSSFESNQSLENHNNINKVKIQNENKNLTEFIDKTIGNMTVNTSPKMNSLPQKNQFVIEIDNPKKVNQEYQEILNEIEVVNKKKREKLLEIKKIERKIKGIKHIEKLNNKSKKIIKNKSQLYLLLNKLKNQELKTNISEKANTKESYIFYQKNENLLLPPHRYKLLKVLTPRNWLFVLNHVKKFGFKGYFQFFERQFCGISYYPEGKRVGNGGRQTEGGKRKEAEGEIRREVGGRIGKGGGGEGTEDEGGGGSGREGGGEGTEGGLPEREEGERKGGGGERGREGVRGKRGEKGGGRKICGAGSAAVEEGRGEAATRVELEKECQKFPSHFIWNEGDGKKEVGRRFWRMNRFLKLKTKIFWRDIEERQQQKIKKKKSSKLILENSKKKANKQKIPLSLSFGSSFLLLRLAKYQSENKITEEKMALDLIQTSMDIKDLAKLYLEGKEEVRWSEDDDRTLLNCKGGNDLGFKILMKFKGRKRILKRTRFKGINLPFNF